MRRVETCNVRLKFSYVHVFNFPSDVDGTANVDRWERCITSEEEALKEAQKVFQKLVDEMSQRTRRIEALKSDKTAKAEELENVEEEIAKVSSKLQEHTVFHISPFQSQISYDKNKALKGVQEGKKVLDAVEKKLDQKKAERHDILQQAKVSTPLSILQVILELKNSTILFESSSRMLTSR